MRLFGKVVNTALSLVLACGLMPMGGMAAFAAEPTDMELALEKSARLEGTSEIGLQAKTTAGPLANDALTVSVGTTGGGSALVSVAGTSGTSITAVEGDRVTVLPEVPEGCYLAQVRYATVESTASEKGNAGPYTALEFDGTAYVFTMPSQPVQVMVDYVSVVWDGTMDVTWYDAESTSFYLRYPAQYAGLAAIVNGLFNCYPTVTVIDDEGTGASHEQPSYQLYKKAMGVVEDDEAADAGESDGGEGAVGTEGVGVVPALANNLYGEFTATYQLSDTQGKTSQLDFGRTGAMTVTQRLVGDANAVLVHLSTSDNPGGPQGQNQTTTADYWYGNDSFNGKTVYILEDLDFGATKTSDGKWDYRSPLFMPVGGQYSILPGKEKTNAYAKLSSSFNGTLDGLGHSFSHVYCERYANTEFGDSQSIGLVGRLGNHDNDYNLWTKTGGKEGYAPAVNPTVRQVVLESGYLSARRTSGGIAGKIGHTSATDLKDGTTGGTIEYCINKATLFGTDKKGIGGIVGAAWNNGVIRCCANFGAVTNITVGANFLAGGIAGSCEVPVIDCYNVGSISAGISQYAEAIGTNNGGARWSNCYYLAGSDHNEQSPGVYTGIGVETVYPFGPQEEIPCVTAALLNGSGSAIWKPGKSGVNTYEGVDYPMLYFQDPSYDPQVVFAISVTQPAEGGTIGVSATQGSFADSVYLTAEPQSGWALDHFVVNGKEVSGSSFILDGDTTVTAVFRQYSTASVTYQVPESADYTFEVIKTGIVIQDGRATRVADYPVASGDTVYEDDVLTMVTVLKEGAAPADVNKSYTGEFTYQIVRPDYLTSATSVSTMPYTVRTEDVNIYLKVSAAKTVYKNWAQDTDVSWYDATSPAEEYVLMTAQQLAGLAALVNGGTTFEGVTVKLGSDISLANADGTTGVREWSPIGRADSGTANNFMGVFDGQGHKVTDMTISHSISGVIGKVRGLFGCISDATIKNVAVEGSITTASGNVVGGLVAQATESNLVQNCSAQVDIAGAATLAGGLIGSSSAAERNASLTVIGCSTAGSVTGAAASADGVGGLVGFAKYGRIQGCAVSATVTMKASSTKCYVGGLMGQSSGVDITQCIFDGAVDCLAASGYAGGVVGKANGNTENLVATVSECLLKGSLAGKASYFGGVIGSMNGRTDLVNCAVTGIITYGGTSTSACIGGLVGHFSNSASSAEVNAQLAQNCYIAAVVSGNNVGAALGYYDRGAFTTQNVYFLKDITSVQYGKKGSYVPTGLAAVAKADSELKALTKKLGDAWADDVFGINSGYPVPACANPVFTVATEGYAGKDGLRLVTLAGWIPDGKRPVLGDTVLVQTGGDAVSGTYQCLLDAQAAQSVALGDFSYKEGQVPVLFWGDVNDNGRVNIVDAQLAYDVALGGIGLGRLGQTGMLAADANMDAKVDAADAFAIQKAVHGGA